VSAAEAALGRLEALGSRPLAAADQAWLSELQSELGTPQSPLTVDALNANRAHVATLRDTLRVLIAAAAHSPRQAHNPRIAERLRERYTSAQFRELFDFAAQHRVFDFTSDPVTGLVRTSGVSNEENVEMGARQWVTDTVRLGDLQREKDPAGWKRAMATLARFYAQPAEQAAFARAIADPRTYRDGGPQEGVAHIFDPHTLARDPHWFNNSRLESHGLALKALAETQDVEDAARAIARLVQYFEVIDYPSAPSVGPWEETKLLGGLSWDTEAIRSGLAALRDGRLDALIERGRQRVEHGVRALEESAVRPIDASSVFIAASDIGLDPKLLLRLLDTLDEKLVRPNGMIRYARDSYLAKNYWVALDQEGRINLAWRERALAFGSKDASDPSVFSARAALATPDSEAEWFMVSDLARGYGTQLARLLSAGGERALIDEVLAKQTRALNRAYARITGAGAVKSNGRAAPAFAVPEAYEAVSAPGGGTAWLPGANTPLGWAAASLYGASRQLLDNLERYEGVA
jgi:hypothetical protein